MEIDHNIIDKKNVDFDIINSIVDTFRKSKYNLKNFMSNIIKNTINHEIKDELLIKQVCKFLDKESKTLKKLNIEYSHEYLIDFALFIFEYFIDVKYLSHEKKAILITSLYEILYGLYNPNDMNSCESYCWKTDKYYDKIKKLIHDKIITRKNDELFFHIINQADNIDKNHEEVYDVYNKEKTHICIVDTLSNNHYDDAEIAGLSKSIGLFDIINDRSSDYSDNDHDNNVDKLEKCFSDSDNDREEIKQN